MKIIKSSFLILLFIFNLSVIVSPQNRSKITQRKSVRLNKKHPTVYLTFEKTGKALNDSTGVTEELVWLKLHNNTRWRIWIQASGGKNYEEARLYYNIFDKDGNIKERRGCHVCSIIPLSSSRSILFTVPLEYFTGAAGLELSFSYDWEREFDETYSKREPTHSVYFYTRNFDKSQEQ
jgi:hypothetical protein